ncbi:MAG: class I mannose-6-phosphate isomerase [Acidobacteriota bacterium]
MLQRLTGRLVEKPDWGTTKLSPWFPDSGKKIGEVWFEGPPGSPLLIKFLFTSAALSVQVHPDDEYGQKHHQSRGKTEMWHILRAEPGAKIAAGFVTPITRERLRSSAESGEIETTMQWYDAHPGDTFFIPAGTVHAIGGGLVLCEIQQTSDVTYRLYDYGRPRELHLDHGVAVSKLEPHAALQASRGGVLVECPYFTTEKLTVAGRSTIAPLDRNQSVIVLEGEGCLGGEQVRAGEVYLITAGSPAVELSGKVTVLRTFA